MWEMQDLFYELLFLYICLCVLTHRSFANTGQCPSSLLFIINDNLFELFISEKNVNQTCHSLLQRDEAGVH